MYLSIAAVIGFSLLVFLRPVKTAARTETVCSVSYAKVCLAGMLSSRARLERKKVKSSMIMTMIG